MADATFTRDADTTEITLENAASAGELREGQNGRAEWLQGASAAIAASLRSYKDRDKIVIPKPTAMAFLPGSRVWFDRTNRLAKYKRTNNRDFYVGTCVGGAAEDATSVAVDMNKYPTYQHHLLMPDWTTENTDGLGVTELRGGAVKLAFDAVAEVAQAAIYGTIPFDVASNPIVEAKFVIVDNGDNAALDIDIGLASASHATNFESIAEFVSFHFDGNALDIFVQSDDTVTDVGPTDTTLNFVEGTALDLWIDARDRDNVKFYVNAVRVLPATVFRLTSATGPLYPIVLMEKTNDDTPAEVRVLDLRTRTSEQ